MLGTRERSLLLESLRPPVGYSLDRALGTTYTLDLAALLSAPLAFTYFNYQDEDGVPTRDPVALFEALRRHAEKITLFCQAGAIAVPRPQLTLLAYLEGSIVQVRASKEGGVFHPKVWLLRYVAHSDNGDEADDGDGQVRYRVLCLSRNLTFDRAWDTCLALEGQVEHGEVEGAEIENGEVTDGGAAAALAERNRPLADFVRALPRLAVRPVGRGLREEADRLAEEVLQVRFEPPAPFKEVSFHPLGLPGLLSEAHEEPWPFPPGRRALVVSPFLSASVIGRLVREQGLDVLVSRPEELEALGSKLAPDLLPEEGMFVLDARAEMDAQEGADEAAEGGAGSEPDHQPGGDAAGAEEVRTATLTGLHAKIFLVDYWLHGYLYVGSANATAAAFSRNVELLVELKGPKGTCGVDALLGDRDGGRVRDDGLRSLLQPYTWQEPEPADPVQQELDRAAARLARAIGAAPLSARVQEVDSGGPYELVLEGRLPPRPEGARVTVWPATLPGGASRLGQAPGGSDGPDDCLARFERVSFDALTAFWAWEVRLRKEGREALERFVVAVPLEGAPPDRRERLLRSLLKDRKQVLRLLLLLLSEDALDVAQLVDGDDTGDGESWQRLAGWDEPTLLEALLQSLVGNPRHLEEAAKLIEDLSKTPEGRDLLPEGFEAIWGPVAAVHRRQDRPGRPAGAAGTAGAAGAGRPDGADGADRHDRPGGGRPAR